MQDRASPSHHVRCGSLSASSTGKKRKAITSLDCRWSDVIRTFDWIKSKESLTNMYQTSNSATLGIWDFMSPTVLKDGSFRFFFFSREEPRMHVHVSCPDGEAKFWIEPIISLATYHGLSKKQLNEIQLLVEKHNHEIISSWKTHFSG